MLKIEWFAWTHYPIRFDRKNQLVHVFRHNGTTYSVPWKRLFFTLGLDHRKEFNKDYYISAHVLADDRQTVIDTFCLSATNPYRKPLELHWEFIRRYMEQGVESVVDEVGFCLPIAKKREGFRMGLLELVSVCREVPPLLLIFIFPILFVLVLVVFSLPRYMAMLTSKIPVWPKEIEAQCQIAEDDPYRLDESNNSTTPWLDLFRRPKPNGETP